MVLYDFLRKAILPLEEIDKNLPKEGKIFDLGCGEGVISKYLASSKKRIVIGIDSDKKRLPNHKTKNLSFKNADIRELLLKGSSGVVISDVLHHLNLKDQKALLTKIAKELEKRGVLVIKEIDKSEFLRSRLSRLWDFILYPQDKINYWHYKELKSFLEEVGFKVKFSRPCRLFPGSTTLFICEK
ncbi:hypothetical protein A2956_00600 [Candidatus Roizmanbacteria bacterium RIFCSPLOWO2_01_FULL_37_57]|nr:MAG: hypothetical protein A2956_00600 [Candidatus Roizmanbacteria bacterium RIFCSPLOWO2_01_FULL_37_57]